MLVRTKETYGQRIIIFAAVALIGIGLLVFSAFMGRERDQVDQTATVTPSPDEYSASVAAQVEDICREAVGCDAKAVVSLQGGYRAVYAEDSHTASGSYKSNMVLVGSGKDESAVLVCYENPEIAGIGVVLSCKEDPMIRNRMISLISAAFSLKTNKIYIAFSK